MSLFACSSSCCPRRPPRRGGARRSARIAWQAGLFATLCAGIIRARGRAVAERIRKATPRARSFHARRHRAQLHLAWLPLPHVRASADWFDDAGDRDADLLRPRQLRGAVAGRRDCGRAQDADRVAHGHCAAARARPARELHLPVPIRARSARVDPRRPPVAVALGDRRDEPLQRARLAPEHQSAEAAGDPCETRRSLTINGIGSIAGGAVPESAFPTTIYIGHPGWKRSARAHLSRS